jgi:hypothetical protein
MIFRGTMEFEINISLTPAQLDAGRTSVFSCFLAAGKQYPQDGHDKYWQ